MHHFDHMDEACHTHMHESYHFSIMHWDSFIEVRTCVCVCMCVLCVRERKREREKECVRSHVTHRALYPPTELFRQGRLTHTHKTKLCTPKETDTYAKDTCVHAQGT